MISSKKQVDGCNGYGNDSGFVIQAQPEQAQWNGGGYYGYPQGYEAYGYAPPTQDPNMFYGGYAGYNYQQPVTYQQPQQVTPLTTFVAFFLMLFFDKSQG